MDMLALLTKVSRSARRLFVCTVLILWTLVGNKALGQTLMVDQAYALLKQGELSKSQQANDNAVEHPSTAESPIAWYLRSYIYQQ